MAIGGDQAGSIRIPAAHCGIVGLKPTYGLVPYTGIGLLEVTLDHAGPMTKTVRDNALMLAAIAGPDGIDGRQRGAVVKDYMQALDAGAKGLRLFPQGANAAFDRSGIEGFFHRHRRYACKCALCHQVKIPPEAGGILLNLF